MHTPFGISHSGIIDTKLYNKNGRQTILVQVLVCKYKNLYIFVMDLDSCFKKLDFSSTSIMPANYSYSS